MANRRFMVGERVLASHEQGGGNHEEGTVYDFYELLINQESIPKVVVDFDDGRRVLLTAVEPDVIAIEEDQVNDEFDEDEPDVDEPDEADDDDLDEEDDGDDADDGEDEADE
ncbi:MAG TPA: hypothetical protein VG265_14325 [Gaiellaceae bacterium]|nr:hypothetical protein [Gaiellaceae bacterium]